PRDGALASALSQFECARGALCAHHQRGLFNLDRMIFVGERSLRRAIAEFVTHYHSERNHRGRDNQLPLPRCRSHPTHRADPVPGTAGRPVEVLSSARRVNACRGGRMLALNRSAIVVRPKPPFLDWLHAADLTSVTLTLADLGREPTIYVVPECGDAE